MAEEQPAEEEKQCPNCKRLISIKTFVLHEVHCKRHIKLCPVCQEPVPVHKMEEHHLENHAPRSCDQCGATMPADRLEDHLESQCPERQVNCKYCELDVRAGDYDEHRETCGSRTDFCDRCNVRVMLKDMEEHKLAKCGDLKADRELRPEPTLENLPPSYMDGLLGNGFLGGLDEHGEGATAVGDYSEVRYLGGFQVAGGYTGSGRDFFEGRGPRRDEGARERENVELDEEWLQEVEKVGEVGDLDRMMAQAIAMEDNQRATSHNHLYGINDHLLREDHYATHLRDMEEERAANDEEIARRLQRTYDKELNDKLASEQLARQLYQQEQEDEEEEDENSNQPDQSYQALNPVVPSGNTPPNNAHHLQHSQNQHFPATTSSYYYHPQTVQQSQFLDGSTEERRRRERSVGSYHSDDDDEWEATTARREERDREREKQEEEDMLLTQRLEMEESERLTSKVERDIRRPPPAGSDSQRDDDLGGESDEQLAYKLQQREIEKAKDTIEKKKIEIMDTKLMIKLNEEEMELQRRELAKKLKIQQLKRRQELSSRDGYEGGGGGGGVEGKFGAGPNRENYYAQAAQFQHNLPHPPPLSPPSLDEFEPRSGSHDMPKLEPYVDNNEDEPRPKPITKPHPSEADDEGDIPCQFCHKTFPMALIMQHQQKCMVKNVSGYTRARGTKRERGREGEGGRGRGRGRGGVGKESMEVDLNQVFREEWSTSKQRNPGNVEMVVCNYCSAEFLPSVIDPHQALCVKNPDKRLKTAYKSHLESHNLPTSMPTPPAVDKKEEENKLPCDFCQVGYPPEQLISHEARCPKRPKRSGRHRNRREVSHLLSSTIPSTSSSSSSEVAPCEYCERLIPLNDFIKHEAICRYQRVPSPPTSPLASSSVPPASTSSSSSSSTSSSVRAPHRSSKMAASFPYTAQPSPSTTSASLTPSNRSPSSKQQSSTSSSTKFSVARSTAMEVSSPPQSLSSSSRPSASTTHTLSSTGKKDPSLSGMNLQSLPPIFYSTASQPHSVEAKRVLTGESQMADGQSFGGDRGRAREVRNVDKLPGNSAVNGRTTNSRVSNVVRNRQAESCIITSSNQVSATPTTSGTVATPHSHGAPYTMTLLSNGVQSHTHQLVSDSSMFSFDATPSPYIGTDTAVVRPSRSDFTSLQHRQAGGGRGFEPTPIPLTLDLVSNPLKMAATTLTNTVAMETSLPGSISVIPTISGGPDSTLKKGLVKSSSNKSYHNSSLLHTTQLQQNNTDNERGGGGDGVGGGQGKGKAIAPNIQIQPQFLGVDVEVMPPSSDQQVLQNSLKMARLTLNHPENENRKMGIELGENQKLGSLSMPYVPMHLENSVLNGNVDLDKRNTGTLSDHHQKPPLLDIRMQILQPEDYMNTKPGLDRGKQCLTHEPDTLSQKMTMGSMCSGLVSVQQQGLKTSNMTSLNDTSSLNLTNSPLKTKQIHLDKLTVGEKSNDSLIISRATLHSHNTAPPDSRCSQLQRLNQYDVDDASDTPSPPAPITSNESNGNISNSMTQPPQFPMSAYRVESFVGSTSDVHTTPSLAGPTPNGAPTPHLSISHTPSEKRANGKASQSDLTNSGRVFSGGTEQESDYSEEEEEEREKEEGGEVTAIMTSTGPLIEFTNSYGGHQQEENGLLSNSEKYEDVEETGEGGREERLQDRDRDKEHDVITKPEDVPKYTETKATSAVHSPATGPPSLSAKDHSLPHHHSNTTRAPLVSGASAPRLSIGRGRGRVSHLSASTETPGGISRSPRTSMRLMSGHKESRTHREVGRKSQEERRTQSVSLPGKNHQKQLQQMRVGSSPRSAVSRSEHRQTSPQPNNTVSRRSSSHCSSQASVSPKTLRKTAALPQTSKTGQSKKPYRGL